MDTPPDTEPDTGSVAPARATSPAPESSGTGALGAVAAGLVHGVVAVVVVATVLFVVDRIAGAPAGQPINWVAVGVIAVLAMGMAVWRRRPGQPRLGIFDGLLPVSSAERAKAAERR